MAGGRKACGSVSGLGQSPTGVFGGDQGNAHGHTVCLAVLHNWQAAWTVCRPVLASPRSRIQVPLVPQGC